MIDSAGGGYSILIIWRGMSNIEYGLPGKTIQFLFSRRSLRKESQGLRPLRLMRSAKLKACLFNHRPSPARPMRFNSKFSILQLFAQDFRHSFCSFIAVQPSNLAY